MTAPPSAEEVAEIAKGLTEAQRDAVQNGRCGVPRGNEEWTSDCICGATEAEHLTATALAYMRTFFPGGIVLTPLGLAVRNHLIGETR